MNKQIQEDIQFFMNRRSLNIDIGFRCPLECPRCQRQRGWRNFGKKVPGRDLTLDEIDKISDYYKSINFCGQLSDPVHHPKFPEILNLLYNKGDKRLHKDSIKVEIHTAASQKSKAFYIKCFKANPLADWLFGIDGLPEESHKYRINQDGKKLFRMMLEAKKILKKRPIWQHIIFKYNEHNIEKAKAMADKHDLTFLLVKSSRWKGDEDYLKPKEHALNAF